MSCFDKAVKCRTTIKLVHLRIMLDVIKPSPYKVASKNEIIFPTKAITVLFFHKTYYVLCILTLFSVDKVSKKNMDIAINYIFSTLCNYVKKFARKQKKQYGMHL